MAKSLLLWVYISLLSSENISLHPNFPCTLMMTFSWFGNVLCPLNKLLRKGLFSKLIKSWPFRYTWTATLYTVLDPHRYSLFSSSPSDGWQTSCTPSTPSHAQTLTAYSLGDETHTVSHLKCQQIWLNHRISVETPSTPDSREFILQRHLVHI